MESQAPQWTDLFSRRDFIKTSAAASLASLTAGIPGAYAAGSDKIRVGLIGCGGRGAHDTKNCLNAAKNVELVAMGDMFKDRLQGCLAHLKAKAGDKIQVPEDARFLGFDAFKKVLQTDVDLVILTTPPHFRAEHARAAIEAGKHVFMEKPVAVDPTGVRSVIETAKLADEKNLTILAGTQMRRLANLVAVVDKIREGAIGDLTSGLCLRMGGGMLDWGPSPRQKDWSDMEWQLRRWLFMDWLSGDFVAEMHVHNLDIMNWALDGHPTKVVAQGGRFVRTDPKYGNAYDMFSAEFEYEGGIRVGYMGRQVEGGSSRCDQRVFGTKGVAYMDFANSIIEGENPFKYDGPSPHPEVKQHADQIDAIRNNKHLNEGKRIAESSLTAIMVRMSAYTGNAISWKYALNSKLDLRPPKYEMGDLPMPEVSIPGKTKLV